MALRGIRGAIDVAKNERREILVRTRLLLEALIRENAVKADSVASVIFSLTPDLDAEFPAIAARELGWSEVPLLCCQELRIPGSMKRVVRILILVNTNRPASKIRHQYLGKTPRLRPDLAGKTVRGGRT